MYTDVEFFLTLTLSVYSTELPGANSPDRYAFEEQIHLIYPLSCEEEKTVSK